MAVLGILGFFFSIFKDPWQENQKGLSLFELLHFSSEHFHT